MSATSAVSKPESMPSTASADLVARQRQRLRPRSDGREIEKPVLGENMLHALARARAPHRDDDALAGGLQPFDMLFHRVEDVGVRLAALGGEVVPGVGADVDHVGAALGRRKRRQPRQRRAIEPLAPLGFGEIEPIRRQRLVRRAAAGLIDDILARLIIVGDLRQPLVRGFLRERLDGDGRRRQIVEQRFKLPVKQRQPVLGAGRPAAFAHRFVEHVVGGRRAEGRHIAGTKQPDGVGGELEFRHRHQIERAQFLGRALGFRIEAADRFQRVAEEIEPHRVGHAGRKQIDDAAAHRVIAGLAHRPERVKPLSSSHSMTPDIARRFPGAAESDCRASVSRGGTRWRMALTGVSKTAGRSRPLTRARRASVIMRCATTVACGETRS